MQPADAGRLGVDKRVGTRNDRAWTQGRDDKRSCQRQDLRRAGSLPPWQAAERHGTLIFIHQGDPTLVTARLEKYLLINTIGNLVDRTVIFASLVFGGVIDRFPGLKICLAHGGGYSCIGIGHMDCGRQVRPEARTHIETPPSEYL